MMTPEQPIVEPAIVTQKTEK